MGANLDKEKQCLEIIDRALKRLVAPAILIGVSLYIFGVATENHGSPFLSFFALVFYSVFIGLAFFYLMSVLNVVVGEFNEIELPQITYYIYVGTLAACYISSLVLAVLAIHNQIS